MPQTMLGAGAPYHSYWAKSGETNDEYHLLPYHLLDVAACMDRLMARINGAAEHVGRLLGLEDGVVNVLVWLAGLHDIGKFANSFQSLAPEIQARLGGKTNGVPYNERHDALGKFLLAEWIVRGEDDWLELDSIVPPSRGRRTSTNILIEAVAGHHGRPTRHHSDVAFRRSFTEGDLAAARTYVDDWTALQGRRPTWSAATPDTFNRDMRLGSWAVAGWMVLADWLGSNRDFFPFRTEPLPLTTYWEHARARAEVAVAQSGVIAPPARQYRGFDTLFPEFKEVSPMQDYASTTVLGSGPQLFVLEDATGSGKTEAALILASRMMSSCLANGVYIGLPTTATANGMFARMRTAYQQFFEGDQPSIVLAHSSRKISDDFQRALKLAQDAAAVGDSYDGEGEDVRAEAICAAWLGDTSRKALLAPFGVGTVDQALLGVLPTSHQSLRLVGMARKVLIIDEVHGYDVYMTQLLCTLLEFHAAQGGSAVLLSATLPAQTRAMLVDAFARGVGHADTALRESCFPLATRIDRHTLQEAPITQRANTRQQTAHEVSVELIHDVDLALEHLLEAAAEGRCGCWIRNTVDEAMAAYEAVVARLPDPSMATLFHARFALGDRQEIEEDVLRRFGKDTTATDRAGRIVIATQVVEQSLDLDFDHMVTDLAPIDLVIQRAGRLQRHDRGERPAPQLLVLGPDSGVPVTAEWYSDFFDGSQWVYRDHSILWLTADLLAELGRIVIPADARRLIEGVYGDTAKEFPEALLAASDDAWAQQMVDTATAKLSLLRMDRGYQEDSSDRWIDDSRARTRLGDETVRLRLAKLVDGELRPLVDATRHAWSLSEVSIRATKVRRVLTSDAVASAVARAEKEMFDRAKFCVVVPLEPGNGGWQCLVEDARGDSKVLRYSSELGLQFLEE